VNVVEIIAGSGVVGRIGSERFQDLLKGVDGVVDESGRQNHVTFFVAVEAAVIGEVISETFTPEFIPTKALKLFNDTGNGFAPSLFGRENPVAGKAVFVGPGGKEKKARHIVRLLKRA
jgi:hypothetical protein